MARVDEFDDGLTGGDGFNGAQTIAAASFTSTGPGGPAALFPASPTASIVGEITVGTDEDFYAFDLKAGQVLRLDVDTGAVNRDLVLDLRRPGRDVLFSFSDDPEGADPGSVLYNTTQTRDPFRALTAEVDGLHVIRLRTFRALTDGAYTLHASIMTDPILLAGTNAAETLYGENQADSISGGGGNDLLFGAGGGDSLAGEGGADTLLGDPGGASTDPGGPDTLSGGEGSDSIVGGLGRDLLSGGADNDTVQGGDGNDTLRGGVGNDILEGGDGFDRLEGGDGNDTILASLDGDAGDASRRDTLSGGAGNDWLSDGAGADLLQGGGGADTIVAGRGRDRVQGGAGHDFILSADAADQDVLDGGAGNDTIRGGWADRITGGAGNDRVEVVLNDTLPSGTTFFDGGTGTDTLSLDLSFRNSSTPIRLDGQGPIATLAVGTVAGTFLDFESHVVFGTRLGNDTLIGGAGADTLDGNGGQAELLIGGGGADLLSTGRTGEEAEGKGSILLGGAGGDTLQFLGFSDEAEDTLVGLGDGGDGNDVLSVFATGSQLNLQGGNGNDTIEIAGSIVAVDGGDGLDLLVISAGVNAPGPLTVLNAGGGDGSAVGQVLGDTSEMPFVVDFTGIERIRATGTGLNGDLLEGGDFADTLDGAIGADTLRGGLGNDLLLVDDAGDVVTDTGGLDTIQAGVSWTLAGSFEALVLTTFVGIFAASGTGNTLANRIQGNDGANVLAGLGGVDSIHGGGGADSLSGGEAADTLNGGLGADTLSGGAGADILVLRLDEAEGDVIIGFEGANVAGGDVLRLVGFGADATITLQDGGTSTWQVQGAAGSDLIRIQGVAALAANDFVFA